MPARAERGTQSKEGGSVALPYEGKIVLVERGECTFEEKARHAQDAGAIGVIVINSDVRDVLLMSNISAFLI